MSGPWKRHRTTVATPLDAGARPRRHPGRGLRIAARDRHAAAARRRRGGRGDRRGSGAAPGISVDGAGRAPPGGARLLFYGPLFCSARSPPSCPPGPPVPWRLALPGGLCLMAGLLRARAWRSLVPALAGGLIGFTPWLVYNVVLTHLGSIRHLYSPLQAYSVPTHVAAGQVITAALPIFVGARMNFCGAATVPWPVADLGLLGLAAAALWIRRTAPAGLLHGRLEAVG